MAEADQLAVLFHKLDADGDGYLVRDDLILIIGEDNTQVDQILASLDKTGTGRISFAAWMEGAANAMCTAADVPASPTTRANRAPSILSQTQLYDERRESVQSVESNSSRTAVLGIAQEFNCSDEPDEEIEARYSWCDSDGDGYITIPDLNTAMCHIIGRALTANEERRIRKYFALRGSESTITLIKFARCAHSVKKLVTSGKSQGMDFKGDETEQKKASEMMLSIFDSQMGMTVNEVAAREEIARLESQLESLLEQNRRVEYRCSSWKDHGKRLEDENLELYQTIDTLKEEIQGSSSEATRYKENLNENREQILNLESKHTAMVKQYQSIQEQLKFAQIQIERNEQLKADHNQELALIKSKLEGLQNERTAERRLQRKKKLETMKEIMESNRTARSLETATQKIDELEGENTSLKDTVRKLKEDEAEHLKLLEHLQGMAGDINISSDFTLKGQFGRRDSYLRRPHSQSITSLAKEMKQIEAETANGSTSTTATDSTSVGVGDTVDKAPPPAPQPCAKCTLYSKVKARQTELESSLMGIKSQVVAMASFVDQQMKIQNPDSGFDVESVKQDLVPLDQSLHKILEQLQKCFANERKQREYLEEQVALLEEQIVALNKEILDLKAQLQSEREARERLELENKQLRDELRKMQEQEEEREREREIQKQRIIKAKEDKERAKKEEAERKEKEASEKKIILSSQASEELSAYATYFNHCLTKDSELKGILPLDDSEFSTDLLEKISTNGGILLAKFINYTCPHTIDERALAKKKRSSVKIPMHQVKENLNLVIGAAKSIGVQSNAITISHLLNPAQNPELVISLIAQLVRTQLLWKLNLKAHPELLRILEPNEEPTDLVKLSPEQLLMRWVNYHLQQSKSKLTAQSFESDFKDSSIFYVLAQRIAHRSSFLAPPAMDGSRLENAEIALKAVRDVGVPVWVRSLSLMKGMPSLTLGHCATIFNTNSCLDPIQDEELHAMEIQKVVIFDENEDGTREERALRMWINSLGLHDVYVNNLFADCRDGLVLLKTIDKIEPNTVNWPRIEMKPNNKFKMGSNCNQVVTLSSSKLHCSVVGIGGVDLVNGNRTLTLAVVWQMMRYHIIHFLQEVMMAKFGPSSSKNIDDQAIVKWANEKVVSKGKRTKMTSFRDASLANSHFFLDLLWSIEPRIIDWDLITDGITAEDQILNARYCITIARKLGAIVFLLPEDIVEVKPKMIMTFVASIMAIDNDLSQ